MERKLNFKGLDSWERPVYEDENGKLWKDVDNRKNHLSIENLHTAVNNDFEGEPNNPMDAKCKVTFLPHRIIRD